MRFRLSSTPWLALLIMTGAGVSVSAQAAQSSYFVLGCNPSLFGDQGEALRSPLTRDQIDRVVLTVREAFPVFRARYGILTPAWQALSEQTRIESIGLSFSVANAVFHLLGGRSAHLHTVQATYFDEALKRVAPETQGIASHWWIEDADGNIIDPTWDLFTLRGGTPPYANGRRRSMSASPDEPLSQVKPLLRYLKEKLLSRGFHSDGRPKKQRGK